jgi:hypothetical protein
MDVWVFWVEDMELEEPLAFQMRDKLDGVPGVGGGTVHECQHHCYFKYLYMTQHPSIPLKKTMGSTTIASGGMRFSAPLNTPRASLPPIAFSRLVTAVTALSRPISTSERRPDAPFRKFS